MDDTAIQKLVCQAVVSDQYRARLLGPGRLDVLRRSGLDAREQETLLAIRAETIEEFASGVERAMRLWRRAGKRSSDEKPLVLPRLIEADLPPRGD
jgi:hypothetical protein